MTVQKTGEQSLPTASTREDMHMHDLPETILPLTNPLSHAPKKKHILRGTAILLSALLILAIYLTWHSTTPTAASPTITQQSYSGLTSTPSPQATRDTTTVTSGNGSTIQVYIVGAVKHPGIYTLATGSRVYQLIQAAGGTQPNADLVSINLAARLSDGQEIYILSVGEAPPAYTGNPSGTSADGTPAPSSGSLVNINTASETEMKQALHISAATAKKIVDYRTQHGAYTSVDQLAQVVSKTIYNRIKSLVTV